MVIIGSRIGGLALNDGVGEVGRVGQVRRVGQIS